MTGIPLLFVFLGCIAAMIFLIAQCHVHPFLALLTISLVLALAGGIGLRDIPSIVGSGFSGVFGSIGLVILLGMLIGNLLEKTGAALTMAECAVRLAGKRRPELALALVGGFHPGFLRQRLCHFKPHSQGTLRPHRPLFRGLHGGAGLRAAALPLPDSPHTGAFGCCRDPLRGGRIAYRG